MLSKIVVVVLGIVMVMATALPAQAGGGAGTGEFFALLCYVAAESNRIDRVVNLVDQFGDHQNVRLERVRFICTPAAGTTVEGEVQLVPGDGDHSNCYHAVPLAAPKVDVEVIDPFQTDTLRVDKGVFVCVQSTKNHLNGPVE